jgi:hypothetical protein
MSLQRANNLFAAGLLLAFGSICGWAQDRQDVAPLKFEAGADDFTAHAAGYDLLLRKDGLVLQESSGGTPLRLKLLDANSNPGVSRRDPLAVLYRHVYSGVDLVYYNNHGRLEYDFTIAPGRNPDEIAFAVEGASEVAIGRSGELLARTPNGEMRLDAPVIYQPEPSGARRRISGGYVVDGNRVGFQVAAYDHSKPLIIDPVVNYSTYVGNSGDVAMASTADSSGNAYIAGRGTGLTSGLMLLEKVSPDGTTVLSRQTFGAASFNFNVQAVALGPGGSVYIAGYSGVGLPTTAGAFIGSVTSGNHAFVAVLNSSFSLTYCSYLAGTTSAADSAYGVAADAAGNAYITGYTNSTTFPTTPGAFQTTPGASGQPGFVAKFNPSASGAASLVYSTYLSGPTTATAAFAIAVDSSNSAYVMGVGGQDFPVTAGAYQYAGLGLGSGGIYVTKLNATATALTYSAYLGPGSSPYAPNGGLALDSSGNAYLTSTATISDFPTTGGAYQTLYPGAFAAELNTTGTSLIYSTFLAGPSSALSNTEVQPESIALPPGCASACSAYISGYAAAADFPAVNPVQSFDAGGGGTYPTFFVVEVAGNGSAATYSTYLGGSGYESPTLHLPGIGVMSTGDAIVAGQTSSSDFPVTLTTTPVRGVFSTRINAAAGSLPVAYPTSLSFSTQTVTVPSAAQIVTLRNMGSTTLAISSVAATGDYSQTDTCGTSVAGGGECTVSVVFTPTSNTNPRTGTVTVNGPSMVTLTGTGANGAYVNLTPLSLTFTSQTVGSAAPAQNVVVSNVGNQALTFNNPPFSMSGDFAQTNNCPASLASNTSCTASVSFLPTQEGQRTGSMSISTANNTSPNTTVNLAGTGAAGNAALTLAGSGLVYNPQTVGVTSSTQTLTVSNTGNVPVTIFSAVASGDYLATGCVQNLNPGASCGVRVSFTPTASGTRTGVVTITDSTAASPHTFTLTGTGVAAAQTITITPSSLVFADEPVGQTTAAKQIIVTNTGDFPVTFDRIVESGNFRITSATCTTLSFRTPPATCTISVVFTPTATGARTGSIVLTDSATGSPQTVSLSGNGLTASTTATLSPATLSFNNQPVGLASNTQNVVLTNTGNVPINLASATFTGTNPGDFGQTNSCIPGSITPTRTCIVTVTFTPTATGSRTATLSIADDAGTQTVALSGTGTTANVSIGFAPATTMTFQAQATGTTSPTQNLVVANNGNEPLTISNIVIAGNYTLVYNPCITTIQPNVSCTMQVNYVPTGTTGTQLGTITFTDNAGTLTQVVNLTGQNVATGPAIKLTPAGLAFAILPIGTTSAAQTVSVNNTSASTVTGLSVGNPVPATDFAIASGSNNCGTSLNAAATCSFQVTFDPTAAGSRAATITVSNSAANQTLNLAGFGETSTLSAYVKDSSLVFPNQVIATTSANQNITLTNNGDVPLTIASVGISGANMGDFTQSNSCPIAPSTLNAGTSCNVGMTFTPSASGNRTATVTITDNAPGSPRNIAVSGIGLTAAQGLEIDRKVVVFPSESVGSNVNQPNPQTVTLTNTGNSPVTISSIVSSSAAFVVSNSCPVSPSTLPPGPTGNTCTFSVTFTPSAAGHASGTVTITDSAPGASPTVAVSGTGLTDTKTVAVTPASLVFIPQLVGTTSATQSVTVNNTGNANITMNSVTVTGNYSITSNGCPATYVLTPATNCSISIAFTPLQAKVLTGTLTITDTATSPTQKVTLTGTGIASTSEISLSQTSVVFDQQVVGVPSQQQTVYYYNQSNAAVSITSVTPPASDFTLPSNSCSGSIGALSYCYIKIVFNPTTTGLRTGTIVIADSAPGSPRTINLSGTGVSAAAPQATLTPTSLTFASQALGTTSPAQNINLTNSGEASMTVTGISLAGSNPGDYAQTNTCQPVPFTLTAGFSCTISVTFKPLATGTRTASVSIADNAAGTPQTVALSGTGAPGTTPLVTFTPPSLTFANVPLNTASASQNSTLTNTGAAPLTITGIAASGTVTGDFAQNNNCPVSPSTIAVNGTCTITVTFTPTSTINQTGAVTVTDNTPNGTDLLALSGYGVAPEVNLSTTSLAFGSQAHGTTSAAKTVTVENAGSLALTINSITATSNYNIVNNTCPSSLGPGLTCTFGVTFSPTITGTDNGYAMIGDNAGDSPQFITLTGTGT